MSDLIWLEIDDFINKRQKSGQTNLRELQFCEFEISPKTLRDFFPIEADDYVAPFTYPGPCLKWYGIYKNIYFMVICYLGDRSSFSLIEIFAPNLDIIDWHIFENEIFPKSFLKKINWISGNKDSSISLFSIDNDGLKYEFYRAENIDDAKNLKEFLENNRYKKNLFISDSEDYSLTWTVETKGEIVARYKSKYDCERYALLNSKDNNSLYIVLCESLQNGKQIIFKNGKML